MGSTIPTTFRTATPASSNAYVGVDDLGTAAAVLQAGARARAVADAFAAAGLAAVLMDGAGRVLHVGAAAQALFGDRLRIEADHLVGRDAEGNAAIETVLNDILGGGEGRDLIVPIDSGASLVLTAVAYADRSPLQLLRAVMLLGTDGAELCARLQALDL